VDPSDDKQPYSPYRELGHSYSTNKIKTCKMPGPYFDLYDDPAKDFFVDNYAAIYAEYAEGLAPSVVRTNVGDQGNSGVHVHHLVHVRKASAPVDDPGKIITIHRTTRYRRVLGQPPSALDDVMYGFQGDSTAMQLPLNVEMSNNLFNKASAVQAPTAARLAQLLQDEPAATMFGPFAATDADVEALSVRNLIWVPNKYAKIAMMGLTPRDAWITISASVFANSDEIACADLLAWLRVAITRKAQNETSRVAQPPLQAPAFDDMDLSLKFQAYRLGIMQQDLPDLSNTAVTTASTLVADGLADLVLETRRTREQAEAHRQAAAHKSPRDFYESSLSKLMRLCQVVREADLPAYHTTIANVSKVGVRRLKLQNAITAACEDLGYNVTFNVSSALARKIHELRWDTSLPDDLATGVSIFNLGPHDLQDALTHELRNAEADLLQSGGSTPNHRDAALLLDATGDIATPKTFIDLVLQVQRAHALWQVLLGSLHPLVQQHSLYLKKLHLSAVELDRVGLPHPQWRLLKWASFARRIHIDTNFWLRGQQSSDEVVPVPDFCKIFNDIALRKPWWCDMPASYIQEPPAPLAPARSTPTPPVPANNPAPANNWPPPVSSGPQFSRPIPSAGADQIRSPGVVEILQPFRALSLITKAVKDYCKTNNVELPKRADGKPMCLAYHIKGMCNERCKFRDDHGPHHESDDNIMAAWCAENYKTQA
jgi:hypothetical protein